MRISDWSSDVCSSDLDGDLSAWRSHSGRKPVFIAGEKIDLQKLCSIRLDFPGPIPVADLVAVIAEGACKLKRLAPRADIARSEERRVGKECVSTCRSRWSPYH